MIPFRSPRGPGGLFAARVPSAGRFFRRERACFLVTLSIGAFLLFSPPAAPSQVTDYPSETEGEAELLGGFIEEDPLGRLGFDALPPLTTEDAYVGSVRNLDIEREEMLHGYRPAGGPANTGGVAVQTQAPRSPTLRIEAVGPLEWIHREQMEARLRLVVGLCVAIIVGSVIWAYAAARKRRRRYRPRRGAREAQRGTDRSSGRGSALRQGGESRPGGPAEIGSAPSIAIGRGARTGPPAASGRASTRPFARSELRRVVLVTDDEFVAELVSGVAADRGMEVLVRSRVVDALELPAASILCLTSGWEGGVDRILPADRRAGSATGGPSCALLLDDATRAQVWTAVARGAVACRVGPVDLTQITDALERLHAVAYHAGPAPLPEWVRSALIEDLLRAGEPPPTEIGRVLDVLGAEVRPVAGGSRGGASFVVRHGHRIFVLVDHGRRRGVNGVRALLPAAARHYPIVSLDSDVVRAHRRGGLVTLPAGPFVEIWMRLAKGDLTAGERGRVLERLLGPVDELARHV